jgi:hypothetical protein
MPAAAATLKGEDQPHGQPLADYVIFVPGEEFGSDEVVSYPPPPEEPEMQMPMPMPKQEDGDGEEVPAMPMPPPEGMKDED